ncbi:MAG: hypothetical protein ACI8RZ_004547 [Myxococcota bacterium]|jgi:hypothetical protein
MTRRLPRLPGAPSEQAEVVARIALPGLADATAVLLESPSGVIKAAAALSPVLSGDPRSAPILRQLALGGIVTGSIVTDSIALLARNPGARPDVAETCQVICDRAEQSSVEWWHSRPWLGGLAGLAHLGHPDAADRVGSALEAWEEGSRNRWVDTEGIGAVLVALGAMGPRLRRSGRLWRRLEALQEVPHAAFPLAAAGDRLALIQLAAHPDTAPLTLAFPSAAASDALARSLTISDAGLQSLRLMMSSRLSEKPCRALVEQAAALIISGEGDESAARIVQQGVSLLQRGWWGPLLAAMGPPSIRRLVLSALAASGSTDALAAMLVHRNDSDWAAMLPPGQPGVEAVIRRHCASQSPNTTAAWRAQRTRMLLSLSAPPPALIAAQLRYGRPEAIAAALRSPDAIDLLSAALQRRRIWRSDAAVYRFRLAFSDAIPTHTPVLRKLAADRDLRVRMFAEEALLGLPVAIPVDHACPGTRGWIMDFQTRGYLSMAA